MLCHLVNVSWDWDAMFAIMDRQFQLKSCLMAVLFELLLTWKACSWPCGDCAAAHTAGPLPLWSSLSDRGCASIHFIFPLHCSTASVRPIQAVEQQLQRLRAVVPFQAEPRKAIGLQGPVKEFPTNCYLSSRAMKMASQWPQWDPKCYK